MKYFFCPVAYDTNLAIKTGAKYVNANKKNWIALPDNISDFISPGYNRGSDFIVYNGKTYDVKKTFTFIEGSVCNCVIMGFESIQGCDLIS